jgi:hypothetical protein
MLPNTLDVRSGVVSALPVLPLQRYYSGRLTGTGSRQQESCGRLSVMTAAAAAATVMASGQRYVASASQRYDRTGIVVSRRSVFGVTIIDSEMYNYTYYSN